MHEGRFVQLYPTVPVNTPPKYVPVRSRSVLHPTPLKKAWWMVSDWASQGSLFPHPWKIAYTKFLSSVMTETNRFDSSCPGSWGKFKLDKNQLSNWCPSMEVPFSRYYLAFRPRNFRFHYCGIPAAPVTMQLYIHRSGKTWYFRMHRSLWYNGTCDTVPGRL